MATRSEVESYQSVIDGLSTVAFAQIKALLQSLDDPNPITFRNALLATYPEMMAPFMSAAGEVASQWYAELRASAGLVGVVAPFVAPLAPQGQLDAIVRHSLTPLFRPQEFIGSGILELLVGASQRLIANQGRETIVGSVMRDPVRVGYARIPRLGCCAFCGMLASRGASYNSAESAGRVVGRGVDASETAGKVGGQGRGRRSRGNQAIGEKYHNFCRCVVAPRFVGGDNDYMQEVEQYFTGLYRETGGVVDGATNLKATLASWRQEHGTK